MTSLADVMRAMAVWTPPPGGDNPFTLSCRVGSGATAEEIVQAAGSSSLPDEVKELWTASRESWLFEDTEYGQWGCTCWPQQTATTGQRWPAQIDPASTAQTTSS